MPAALKMSLAMLLVLGTSFQVAWANCADEEELDLCDYEVEEMESSGAVKLHATGANSLFFVLMAALRANDVKSPALGMLLLPLANMLPKAMAVGTTCGHLKEAYKNNSCCGYPSTEVPFLLVPNPATRLTGTNPCDGQKSISSPGMDNRACFLDAVRNASEQSGADVTQGYTGGINTSVVPIAVPYYKTALCPVNVHWHLGAEHRSEGQFDENGTSPANHLVPADDNPGATRRLGSGARYGFACRHYDANNLKFNTEYDWKHCKDMHVGETYEVHWPHSAFGACGTPNQYQYPFYDGVFCMATDTALAGLQPQDIASGVGVQGQVFTIINDDAYYYPDLARGMIVDSDNNMGVDVAAYTGSTTGTTRDNSVCSAYTPITWQVDRKCHLISASSFDKMCADMAQMRDDMSGDMHPHGARELVWNNLTANNHRDLER